MEFRQSKLKSLCLRILGGGTPDTDNPEYWNGAIPWITSSDIYDNDVLSPRKYISEKGIKNSATNVIPKGSIIIVTRVGVGKICINPYDVCISQDSHGLLIDHHQITSEYLLFYLLYRMPFIKEMSQGSTVKGITKDFLENIVIEFPEDILAQIEIANMLKRNYASINRINHRVSEQSDAIKILEPSILREAFFWNSITSLPEGWEWKKLSEIADVNPRRLSSHKQDKLASFLPMNAVDEISGSISYLLTKPMAEVCSGYTYFENDDILFAKITPCMQNGKCCIVQGLLNGYGFGSTEFVVIRPRERTFCKWIFYYLRTLEFRRYAEDHFTGSAGQQRVPIDLIEDTSIPMPKETGILLSLTSVLDRKTSICHKLIAINEKQLQGLKVLDHSILKEVFDNLRGICAQKY